MTERLRLFNGHRMFVKRLARNIYSNQPAGAHADFSDIFETGLIALWRLTKDYPGSYSDFHTKAGQRIFGAMYDELRKSVRADRRAKAGGLEREETEDPAQILLLKEELEELGRYIRSLDKKSRTAIQLYFWQDASFEEVGQKLNMTKEGAWRLTHRTLARLKQKFNSHKSAA